MRPSELVLSSTGLPYHTHLGPGQLADNVILVGDPARVTLFKQHLDHTTYESTNREMHALCGTYHGTPVTILSTGMGCDNIDIVLTELEIAANIDLATSRPLADRRHLRIVRIGTCGSLHADLPCGSPVASAYAVGMDGLLNYYQHDNSGFDTALEEAFCRHVTLDNRMARPYAVAASRKLLQQVASDIPQGITVTAPGFYAPQGRHIRVTPTLEHLNDQLATFQWNGLRINNLEMETSGIYGMAQMYGHDALTVCLVIANRATGQFLTDYTDNIRQLIDRILQRLVG